MFVLCRFIARLEEQIHEWKLNTVTLGAPLTKVVATFNLQLLFLLHWTQKCMLSNICIMRACICSNWGDSVGTDAKKSTWMEELCVCLIDVIWLFILCAIWSCLFKLKVILPYKNMQLRSSLSISHIFAEWCRISAALSANYACCCTGVCIRENWRLEYGRRSRQLCITPITVL